MEPKKLVTHDGSFHSDDIFSCATISLILELSSTPFTVTRTRDEELVKTADYVFDVGGVYNADMNRFDHHQKGGAGKHANGIEYASFGLVWEKFGTQLTGGEKTKEVVEQRLVSPIDAGDNGINLIQNLTEVSPYFLHNVFGALSPSWKEAGKENEAFFVCVEIAKNILRGEIKHAADGLEASEKVLAIYNNTNDKRVIVLDDSYPYEFTLKDFIEPMYVVLPRKDSTWSVRAVRENPATFSNKKNLPETWGGLKDEELQNVSGVVDAIFCHRALFLAVAKSKEGAIKLAQIALQS